MSSEGEDTIPPSLPKHCGFEHGRVVCLDSIKISVYCQRCGKFLSQEGKSHPGNRYNTHPRPSLLAAVGENILATSLQSTPTTPPVLDELHDSPWWKRKQVADRLGRLESLSTNDWHTLTSLLQDENTHVLRSALQVLTKPLSSGQTALSPEEDPSLVIAPLLPLLNNGDREIRTAASQSLMKLGKPALHALLKLYEQPISYEYVVTDTICGMKSADVVSALMEALTSTTNVGNTRRVVLKILQQMKDLENHPFLLPVLKRWLRESLPNHEKKTLIQVLAQIGDTGVHALGEALQQTSLPQIETILEELQQLQHKSLPALDAVVALLDSTDLTTVHKVASVLAVMGAGIRLVLPRLGKYFLEDSYRTRTVSYLARALVQAGKEALPIFEEALQHPEQSIRSAAAEQLGELGDIAQQTVPLLLEIIRTDQDTNVKQASLRALGRMGESVAWVVPALLESHGQAHDISEDILNAVCAIGFSETELSIVLALVKDQPHNPINRKLYEVVARLGLQAIPALESWLQEDDERLRTAAISILAQMSSEAISVLPRIRDILERTSSVWEWDACLDYLQKMGAKAQDAFSSVIAGYLYRKDSHRLREVWETVLRIGQQRLERYVHRFVHELQVQYPDIVQQLLRICDEMLAPSLRDLSVFSTQPQAPDWPEHAERIRAARRILLQKQMSPVTATEDGLEQENEGDLVRPDILFDPAKVRMESRTPTLDLMLKRIAHGELELQPSFQRKTVWTDAMQSRLIESLLLRIPLPSFYVDASDEDKWLVIDGQQRLTAVERFVNREDQTALRLSGLEFLSEYEGYSYGELPRPLQRRIVETQIAVYTVERGTPSDVKFIIFKRINTGGLPLSTQEIRHALFQGPATNFLRQLAESEDFKIATDGSIQDQRMAAQELVLRFIAFLIHSLDDYQKSGSLETFLNQTMEYLNQCPELERQRIESQFYQAMRFAVDMFGSDAFRKQGGESGRRYPINRALFDAWTVNLAKLSPPDLDYLLQKREFLRTSFGDLLKNHTFHQSISTSTGTRFQVETRMVAIKELLDSTLHHHQEKSATKTLLQTNPPAGQKS